MRHFIVPAKDREAAAQRYDTTMVNSALGLGVPGLDKLQETGIEYSPLPPRFKEALYAGSRYCRKVVEIIPEYAIKKGWQLKDVDKPELIGDIQKYLDRVCNVGDEDSRIDLSGNIYEGLNASLLLAITLSRIVDGAVIVMNVDDGEPADQPIKLDKIKTIVGMEVLDRYDIRPEYWKTNNPYKPDYYELMLGSNLSEYSNELRTLNRRGNSANRYFIHPSRIIRFDGVMNTRRMMQYNDGWGGSPLDFVWESYQRYQTVEQGVANMVHQNNMLVHKMKNFREMQMSDDPGDQQRLAAMLKDFHRHLNMLGAAFMDAEEEELTSVDRRFNGIGEMMGYFRESMIADSDLPHTIIMGEAPGGVLGPTGENEDGMVAAAIERFQSGILLPALRRIVRIALWAKDGPTGGKPPKGWTLITNSPFQEKQTDKLANQTSQAQNDSLYLQNGVLTVEEVRDSRFGSGDYSYETKLDKKAWEKAKKEQEEAAAQQQQLAAGGDPYQYGGGQDQGGDEFSQEIPDDSYRENSASNFVLPSTFLLKDTKYSRRYARIN